MEIEAAIEVFMGGFAFTRSYTYPFVIERLDTCSVMRDAPGRKRNRRLEEFVACRATPRALHKTAAREAQGRYAISYIRAEGEPAEPIRTGFRELGYRLIWTEPFFVHRLTQIEPVSCDFVVSRVTTAEEADNLAKAVRARQILAEHLESDDPPIRQYVAKAGDGFAGMVKSIRIGGANWCSALLVRPEFRRRGIGRALMTRMLLDDREHGSQANVLLASSVGARLYPTLGYERIGELMIFRPSESGRPGG